MQRVVNSGRSYHLYRIILASCLTPSCDLTERPLSHNVTLRREADLRDTLIKLCRARERREGQSEITGMSECMCVCEHAGGGGGHLTVHTIPVVAWPAETPRVHRRSWWEGWSERPALPPGDHETGFPSWQNIQAGPRSCAHIQTNNMEIQAEYNTFYVMSYPSLKGRLICKSKIHVFISSQCNLFTLEMSV